MRHVLKCDQPHYDAVVSGAKTFEIRFNDRDYAVGDELELHPMNAFRALDPDRSVTVTVTYMVEGEYGLRDRYVVLGFDAAKGDE